MLVWQVLAIVIAHRVLTESDARAARLAALRQVGGRCTPTAGVSRLGPVRASRIGQQLARRRVDRLGGACLDFESREVRQVAELRIGGSGRAR